MEELQRCLEDERFKISKERADAEASLRASLDRIRMEAAEELKRHEEAAARQLEQQNNIIVALQVHCSLLLVRLRSPFRDRL